MASGIERLKLLSEKTKHLKNELKNDIACQDEEIDKLIAKLGFEFLLSSLQPN